MLRHTPSPLLLLQRGFRSSSCLCRDYYQVLGLPRTCTAKDIRSKYMELCKLYHPDTVTSGDQNEVEAKKKKFQEVQEAYNILSKDTDRRMYDDRGPNTTEWDRAAEWQRRQYRPHEQARDPYARAYEYHRRRREQQDNDTGGWTWGSYWTEDPEEKRKDDEYYRRQREHFERQKEEWARFGRERAAQQDSSLRKASAVVVCFCFMLSGLFINLMLDMTNFREKDWDEERKRILAMSERRNRGRMYDVSNPEERQRMQADAQTYALRYR